MTTNEKTCSKKMMGFPKILMSLALTSLLIIFWLWRMPRHMPNLFPYAGSIAQGATSIWMGYKMLNLFWILLVSISMVLLQIVVSGMLGIKRLLAILFFLIGQILLLYSIYFPLISVIALFYFGSSWYMKNLILENRYAFK